MTSLTVRTADGSGNPGAGTGPDGAGTSLDRPDVPYTVSQGRVRDSPRTSLAGTSLRFARRKGHRHAIGGRSRPWQYGRGSGNGVYLPKVAMATDRTRYPVGFDASVPRDSVKEIRVDKVLEDATIGGAVLGAIAAFGLTGLTLLSASWDPRLEWTTLLVRLWEAVFSDTGWGNDWVAKPPLLRFVDRQPPGKSTPDLQPIQAVRGAVCRPPPRSPGRKTSFTLPWGYSNPANAKRVDTSSTQHRRNFTTRPRNWLRSLRFFQRTALASRRPAAARGPPLGKSSGSAHRRHPAPRL